MPNGNDVLSDLEFESELKRYEKKPIELTKFTARQVFEARKDLARVALTAEGNKRRSWGNRIALIVLVFVLIALGVIDSGMLPMIGIS
jgi:hypothetical protein